jgi:hypothetical protein
MRKLSKLSPIAMGVLALFVILGGTAAAAGYVITNENQIKPSVLKQLHGARGPAGRQGIVGPRGASGTGSGETVQGPQGSKGDAGAKGDDGAAGAAGATGLTGPAGPSALVLASYITKSETVNVCGSQVPGCGAPTNGAVVPCPNHYAVISGGYSFPYGVDSSSNVFINYDSSLRFGPEFPDPNPTEAWEVNVVNKGSSTVAITVYANCYPDQ